MGADDVGEGVNVWIGIFVVAEGKIGSDERVNPNKLNPVIPKAIATIITAASTFIIDFFENNILTA